MGGDQPCREFLRARSQKVADAIAHLRHSWPKKFHATSDGVTVASCQFAANTQHWAHVLYGFCDLPYNLNALISDALPCLVLAPVSGPAVRRGSRKEGAAFPWFSEPAKFKLVRREARNRFYEASS